MDTNVSKAIQALVTEIMSMLEVGQPFLPKSMNQVIFRMSFVARIVLCFRSLLRSSLKQRTLKASCGWMATKRTKMGKAAKTVDAEVRDQLQPPQAGKDAADERRQKRER